MHTVPQEYHGREQTFLKHRVLEEYLAVWSHKLASIPGSHLWYVDVFAGPWQSKGTDRRDTSVAIGLKALQAAASTWEKAGRRRRAGTWTCSASRVPSPTTSRPSIGRSAPDA